MMAKKLELKLKDICLGAECSHWIVFSSKHLIS